MKKNMIVAAAINAMLGRLGEDCVSNHNLTMDSVYEFVQPADSDGWNIVRAIRAIKYEKQLDILNKLMERVNRKIEVSKEDMNKMDKIECWEHRDCLQRIDEDIVWYLQQIENYNKPLDELDYDSEMAYYEMESPKEDTTITIHVGQTFHWSSKWSGTTSYVDITVETEDKSNEYRAAEYDPNHYNKTEVIAKVRKKLNELFPVIWYIVRLSETPLGKGETLLATPNKGIAVKFMRDNEHYIPEDTVIYLAEEVNGKERRISETTNFINKGQAVED